MNVYMPAEGIVQEPRRRFLDWRFLAALTGLILVAFFVWAGFRNYEIREAEAAQKDALLSQLADRSNQIETLEGEVSELNDRIRVLQDRAREDRLSAAKDRRNASRERARMLRQQARMLALLQSANIDYHPSVSYVPASDSGSDTTSLGAPQIAGVSATQPAPEPAPTAGQSGKTPSGKAKGLR